MLRVSHALPARAQTGREPTRPLVLLTPIARFPAVDFRPSVCSRAHSHCSIKETGARALVAATTSTTSGMVRRRRCQITSTSNTTSRLRPTTTPMPAPAVSSLARMMALNSTAPSTHRKASLVDGLLFQHLTINTKCSTLSSTRRRLASRRPCFSSKWTHRTLPALDLPLGTETRTTAPLHLHQPSHSTSNINSALVGPCRPIWVLLLLPPCRRDSACWAKVNSLAKDSRQHLIRTISQVVTFLSMVRLPA